MPEGNMNAREEKDQVQDRSHVPVTWPWDVVTYQIYPLSFKDSNGDGTGDLNGIIEKLDYLNDGTEKSLGIRAIWISPFFKSPMRDFGYDVSDYCDVDPLFGTLKDFERLIQEAHKRAMKVIIDFVPNHTSNEHPWFVASRSSRDNPKRDWYIWKDAKSDGGPPNNWRSVFGGSAWEFDQATQQYYLHGFVKEQPDLNWHHPDVKEAMKNVLRFWFGRGVDGIRVDAVPHIGKDPLFRDDPQNPEFKEGIWDPYDALLHTHSKDESEAFAVLRELSGVASEYPEVFMIAEGYPEKRADATEYQKYYRNYDSARIAPFNFELIYLPWQADAYKKFIDAFQSSLEPGRLPVYVLGNHDRSRLKTRIGEEQCRVAAMMLLTLPGMPFVYYGEEIGMEDVPIPLDKTRDPFGKNVLGAGRDPERSPMQWTKEKFAGFSVHEPWLPVSSQYRVRNVEVQQQDPSSFLSLYRALIHYRNGSPILRQGSYIPVSSANPSIFGYERVYDSETIAVFLNFSQQDQQVLLRNQDARVAVSTHLDIARGSNLNLNRFVLRPGEGLLCEYA